MAKRKKTVTPKNDTKVAAIVAGLFMAAIMVFSVFLKGNESHHQKASPISEGVDMYIPNENIKPAEPISAPRGITTEPLERILGAGGKIATIIDDWGQSTANCKYLKEIPEALAVSILPGLRHTKDVVHYANSYHKLTMLHLPLEALHNYDFYPSDYVIKTTMDPALVSKIVDEDLAQLPSVEGVNNHMGSKATEDRLLMGIILKKLKKKGLFFVDSMTARNTVCAPLADEMGLAFSKRDVFLDNINTREAIIKQIMLLAKKARRKGYAVAIGHDRHLTMQMLKEEIPWLEGQGFQIVSIKELLRNK